MKTAVFLSSAALIGLIGCTDYQTASPPTTPSERTADRTTAPPPVAPPVENPSDELARTTPESASPTGLPAMTDADRALAQRVEEALRQDTTVASAAQNIQVHANNGEITLRGSVSNEQEKMNLGSKAQQMAGVSKVNNQLEVTSASR